MLARTLRNPERQGTHGGTCGNYVLGQKKKKWKMRKEQRKLLMWLMLSWLKALDGSIIIIVIIDVVVDILMSLGCTGE